MADLMPLPTEVREYVEKLERDLDVLREQTEELADGVMKARAEKMKATFEVGELRAILRQIELHLVKPFRADELEQLRLRVTTALEGR
jgi:predicted  nucleic acid-binding Zn-ribbon protein